MSGPADDAAAFCAALVDEWVRAGITDAVVAPGSRSTPVALALAADTRLTLHVHHDERAAGFVALGLGVASGRPALVLTTSGTAAVELHASVVEAHQACVPLVAITADRPAELRDVGAQQAIDQQHLFGGAVRWFVDPGVPDRAMAGSWRSLAARAVAEAVHGRAGPGPVHLNLPFREPLVGEPRDVPPGRAGGEPWHTGGGRRLAVDRAGTDRLGELLDAERGVIVAGAGAGEPDAVFALARATGWPVFADPRSGCRVPDFATVAAFDAILRHGPTAESLRPEVVLQLGAPPASKVLGAWMAGSGARVVAVDEHGRWFDPTRMAAHVLHAHPTPVVSALARIVARERTPGWHDRWQEVEVAAQSAIDRALAGRDELTEPGIARTTLAALPDDATLVVSSSMPVRDVEWYGAPRDGVRVLANRGANGIDGVVSTAVGVSIAGKRDDAPTAALVGDVAFLYDSNGLLGLADRGVDLTMVVVHNDGGGIFSFLPQAGALDHDRFEQLYGTPHGVDLAVLAAAHGLMTVQPEAPADLDAAVRASVAAGGARLVVARTDRAANVDVHDQIHAAVASALGRTT